MQTFDQLLILTSRVLILLLYLLPIVDAVIRFKQALVPAEVIFPVGELALAVSDALGVTLVVEPVEEGTVGLLLEEGGRVVGAELKVMPWEGLGGEGDQEGPGELKEGRVLCEELVDAVEEEVENRGEVGWVESLIILEQWRGQTQVLREVMAEEMPFLVEKGTKSFDCPVVRLQEQLC